MLVVVGGGFWLWEDVLEYRVIPKRWGTVVDGQVYRSGQLHPVLVKRTLAKHQIDLVISLIDPRYLSDWDEEADAAEQRACDELGIERRVYPLSGDGTGEVTSYADTIAAIVEAMEQGRRVLVHCGAGAQRTGGAIAAFRVLVQGDAPADARAEMADYDWDPRKDLTVLSYLDDHMAELVGRLVRMGVIEKAPDPLPQLSPAF